MSVKRKFDNDYVLWNDYRIKTNLKLISMILVSNQNVTKYIFEYQSNKNQAFCFFGDTQLV